MADMEVRRFALDDDGQQLSVTVEIQNNSDRTMMFYRDVRGMKYDAATRTLRLLLTDRHRVVSEGLVEVAAMRPPLKAVDPGESETVTLRLPRFLTQLGPEVPGKPGPTIQQSPIYEAAAVEAEISWGDKPFYPEPKSRVSIADQLRRWERGVLEPRIDRRGPAAPPASGTAPEEPSPRRPRRR